MSHKNTFRMFLRKLSLLRFFGVFYTLTFLLLSPISNISAQSFTSSFTSASLTEAFSNYVSPKPTTQTARQTASLIQSDILNAFKNYIAPAPEVVVKKTEAFSNYVSPTTQTINVNQSDILNAFKNYIAPAPKVVVKKVITPTTTPPPAPVVKVTPPKIIPLPSPAPVVKVATPIINLSGRGPQGPQGPVGPRGPAGSSGNIDSSQFVSRSFFDKQVNALLTSIENSSGGGGGTWGSITGTLSSQTDLQTALDAKITNPMTTGGDIIYGGASGAPTRLANGTAGQILQSNGTTLAPSWVAAAATGLTVGTTTITSGSSGNVLYNNAGTLGEMTTTGSGTVLALSASPTFTGTVTIPTPFTLGAVSVLPTGTELNFVDGVTSAIQTQLDAKGAGTVTSVAAITLGTTGTDLSSTVATGTTTPVITLQVPTASAANRGALSAADWSTFNGKQAALTNPVTGTGTINEIAYWTSGSAIGTLAVATYPSLTELSYVKGLTSSAQTQITAKAPSTAPTFATSITGSYLTASEILITDASKNIVSAPVATYPSLTELTYVKGVTSAIQTQLGTKAPLASPTFTGTVTIPTPFTLGATSVTSTGTQLNYLNGATGTTGTTSTNLVFSTSPTLVTPVLGVATGTGLALTSTNTTEATTASALVLNANSLTTGTGFYAASSSLSSGSLFNLIITGTAGLTNQKGLNISLSGANGTGAQTTYGAYLSNTHTGTSTNVGLYSTASGGTNNYAAIFDAGNVGIGTTAPLLKLDVAGSGRFTGTATSVLTGSIDPTASTAVVGVGTLFTTELVVGDRITVSAETRTVTAITDATNLTVDTAFTNTANDTTPDKLAATFIARDSSNVVRMALNDSNLNIGSGGLTHAWDTSITTISALEAGNFSFDTDAGASSWVDMPVTSAALDNTIERYSAQLDGNSIFTIYGLSNGAGGVDNLGVGIGTTTPTSLLHVKGNLFSPLTGTVAVTAASTTVTGTSTLFTTELVVGDSIQLGNEIFTVSAIASATSLTIDSAIVTAVTAGSTAYRDPTLFTVDNGDAINKLTITKSGNVGVGTASPSGNLAITQIATATGVLKGIVYTGAVNTNQTLSTEIPSLTLTTAGRQWATGALTTQREVLITQPTYSFVGASTVTDAATLGIAGAPIQSTNATLTNTHGLLIQAGAVSTATNSYGLTVNTQTGATNNYAATFLGGNVGIGTAAPSNIFHVTGTPAAGTGTARIANTLGGTTKNNGLLILAGNDTGVTASEMITFQRPDATVIGSISQNAATTVAYNTSSDLRIKENIAPTTFGLSDLLKINVSDFTFISDPNKQKMTGFIAQDLYNIFGGAVTPNGDNGIDPLTPGQTPWMIDYGKLTPLIVKSVQDLNLKIEGLEERIATLEANGGGIGSGGGIFASVVKSVEGSVAYLKALVLEGLTVGSSEKRTGITLYDEITGDPYCLSIADGAQKTTAGECKVIEPAPESNSGSTNNPVDISEPPTEPTTPESEPSAPELTPEVTPVADPVDISEPTTPESEPEVTPVADPVVTSEPTPEVL